MKHDFIKVRLSRTNCFLIKADEGYLLVDSGFEWDRDLFIKRLNRHDIRIGQISYLLLTHHHDDHTGLVNYLVARNPKIKIIMHEECARLIKKGENDMNGVGGYINTVIQFFSLVFRMLNPEWNRTFPPYTARPSDIIVKEEKGDELRRIGVGGTILFTPGHSTDSIAILMDNGDLFAGDSAMNLFKWAGTGYASLYIADTVVYYGSWKKILDSNPRIIIPSHGRPFSPDKLRKNMGRIKQGDLVKII